MIRSTDMKTHETMEIKLGLNNAREKYHNILNAFIAAVFCQWKASSRQFTIRTSRDRNTNTVASLVEPEVKTICDTKRSRISVNPV